MTINLVKHLTIRVTSSIIAFMIYIILFSLLVSNGSFAFFGTFVFYLGAGFFFAYKAVVILPIVSLLLDLPIGNVLLRYKFPNSLIQILGTFLSLFYGALIAIILYGFEDFFIVSGAIISLISHLIFKVLWRLSEI